jgi:PST family polysaccharide transporter
MRTRLLLALRHPVTQNAAALYAMTFVLTVLPVVTLPWVARALGPHELGRVVFVQSASFLLAMLVEYGFALSATRELAGCRDDGRAMKRTVAGVQGAKAILGLGVTAVAIVAYFAVPEFHRDAHLLVFAWALALLQGFNCGWFFTGLERMRTIAATEVTVRLLSGAALIAFVRDPGDGDLVLWIWTGAAAASLVVLTAMMYRIVPVRLPARGQARRTLRGGWPLFVTTAAVSLYTTATVFMLGLSVAAAQLALFSGAERVVRASLRATTALAGATYPRISFLLRSGREQRAQRLALVASLALGGIGLVSAAILIVIAPWIVDVFLGPQFHGATPILQVLALLVPLGAVNTALVGQWLLPRGLDHAVTRIVVAAGLLNLALTPMVAQLAGPIGVAWALVGLEGGIIACMALLVVRERVAQSHPTVVGRPTA